jgi:hypothetical protein
LRHYSRFNTYKYNDKKLYDFAIWFTKQNDEKLRKDFLKGKVKSFFYSHKLSKRRNGVKNKKRKYKS